ncbi:MAG: ribbon-helix-helix protein, CopG family [Candidatus Aminicenantes bacterium]|nr:ribbon-helix-helix protein, CopG family [Candidatus Aminicenantes bacterium]
MTAIKTAISIDDRLFDQINKLSNELKISRSQIFSQAVRYFIERKNNLELVRKINRAYSDVLDEDEMERLEMSKQKYKEVIKETWQ